MAVGLFITDNSVVVFALKQLPTMRPDEHKKKRSAQYQKKHGKAKGKDESEGKPSQKPSKGTLTSSKNDSSCRVSSGSTRGKPKDKTSKTPDLPSSDSDGEVKVDGEPKRTYRKREVLSNWAKYDLPSADEASTQAEPKGEDFNKLLASAGHPVTHFRFKEEQAWEEDSDERECTSEYAVQLLTLDCAQLASSLACIPLYRQLHLDTHIFTPSQILSMDSLAAKHRETYMKICSASSSSQSLRSKPSLEPDESASNSSANVIEKPDSQHFRGGSVDISANILHKEGVDLSKNTNSASLLDNDEGREANTPKNKLLTGAKAKKNVEKQSIGFKRTLDEELDDLLDNDSVQATNQGQSKLVESVKGTIKESDELEDWLDSVLDS